MANASAPSDASSANSTTHDDPEVVAVPQRARTCRTNTFATSSNPCGSGDGRRSEMVAIDREI